MSIIVTPALFVFSATHYFVNTCISHNEYPYGKPLLTPCILTYCALTAAKLDVISPTCPLSVATVVQFSPSTET